MTGPRDSTGATLEVELKFKIEDLPGVEERLRALGARLGAAVRERDLYFNHPARDYARTDEALRLRRCGDECRITYKGPKLDAETKTREEIELSLGPADVFDRFRQLLLKLQFSPVAAVIKQRRTAVLAWQGRSVEVSLDQVEGLGAFLELETQAPAADLEPAKACLLSLVARLALSNSERRSYLELLLARR